MSLVRQLARFASRRARFLLSGPSDDLPGARVLTVSSPLVAADDGPGSTLTLSVSNATSDAAGVVRLAGQLGGSADAPDVRGLRTPGAVGEGPQLLGIGVVANGQALVRSGTSLVGVAVLPVSGGSLSGDLNLGGHLISGVATGTQPDHAATYGQLVSMINGLDWQQSVLDKDLATPPGSPATKDRYLIAASATGAWSGHTNHIGEWTGAAWTFVVPNKGFTVNVEDEGVDYTFNGTAWIRIGASIDHGSLLNLSANDAHPQYQLGSAKDQNNGYAGLDGGGVVNRPVRAIRTGGDPGSPTSGDVWINGSALKFRDAAGSPITHFVEVVENKDQNNGYAGLDGGGIVNRPVKSLRVGGDPGSPASGEIWVNGPALKFRDASGSPVTHFVEVVENKNQNNGYAGLDGSGRIASAQAPPKAVYATGGGQALTPGDVGATPVARVVGPGPGLAGGGDLTADRSFSIAAFSGIVAKDIDPGSATWSANEVKVHQVLDIGLDGQLVPVGIRLPATVDAALRTEVVFEMDNASTTVITNADTANVLDATFLDLSAMLAGSVASSASNNGRRVQKITVRTRNNTGGTITGIDIGAFRVRAWAFPRGGGSAL